MITRDRNQCKRCGLCTNICQEGCIATANDKLTINRSLCSTCAPCISDEERFLDRILLEELGKRGNPGHITFKDPDAIIVLETIGQQAGLSCWTREDLQRYPLLRLE